MANQGDEDPEIGTLNAHTEGEPPQAIVVTPGQTACDVKPHVIAILPTYCGKSYEGPYEFLHEFCKICRAQRRPAGATEDDYRLKALPFVLKGEANTWFMRLPPNSIETWADFKSAFLGEFFPSSKTSALKREITNVKQGYDEPLSDYWARYMGLLESCPNHRMADIEVHHTFYEGMNAVTKDLANSSSGGSFTQLRVSEAKRVLRKLLNAKKEYDHSREGYNRERAAVASSTDQENKLEQKMDLKMDELKKSLLSAIEKSTPPPPPAGNYKGAEQGNQGPNYDQPNDFVNMEQVNAAGYFNSSGHWIQGRQRDAPWRDHPNFRWGDGNQNQNQYNPHPNQNPNRGSANPDYQPNWSGRNQQSQNQNPQSQNPNPVYVPPHQRNFQNFQNQLNHFDCLEDLLGSSVVLPSSSLLSSDAFSLNSDMSSSAVV